MEESNWHDLTSQLILCSVRGLFLSDQCVLILLELSFIGHYILKYVIIVHANLFTCPPLPLPIPQR